MMSEMKARMHSEYQQSNQRLIKEKDDHWKTKVSQQMNECNHVTYNIVPLISFIYFL